MAQYPFSSQNRNFRRFWVRCLLLFGGGIILALLLSGVNWRSHLSPLETFIFSLEATYQQYLGTTQPNTTILLLPFAFGGGLIASISPCVLGLLPVNLSYMGTRDINSRRDALKKASLFVLGVCTMYSILGLFSSSLGFLLVGYRGYISVFVGCFILMMGLILLEVIQLPLPQFSGKVPIAGTYGVGLTFALATSPCSSPLLFAVLATAGETGSPILSTLTMISYAVGYTMLIFLASLFTGLAKQTRRFLPYTGKITQVSSIFLIVLGIYYTVDGLRWLLALWQG
ncbi:cytochrome c biogenesis protein CcdA [Spirulina sp. CS-785/01]|uniref:cytochrome c biogenesis CcdA family protein n=1 Tax=Spirulina sp. CS-785/01 TaxID=3021716 RepID=UPI00232E4BE4|nr:cytochrome c biogenesis protein CcdA [Spirulina sp. CS-785/01]MDB9312048.1 cytochrome c biogenesis protein CcdA [Spirulina sp. CS-785/01]